jgi:hypothetical protein
MIRQRMAAVKNPVSRSCDVTRGEPAEWRFFRMLDVESEVRAKRMDEIMKWAARGYIVDELMAEAINVALPVCDCDIDMLAFLPSHTEPSGLVTVPIQVVVLHEDGLSGDLKAARAPDILLTLVCGVGGLAPIRCFALTSAELIFLKMIGLMHDANVAPAGSGAQCAPAGRNTVLQNAMKQFAMSRGQWRRKLMGVVGAKAQTEPHDRYH